jgi:hypothetical protein
LAHGFFFFLKLQILLEINTLMHKEYKKGQEQRMVKGTTKQRKTKSYKANTEQNNKTTRIEAITKTNKSATTGLNQSSRQKQPKHPCSEHQRT